MPILEKEFKIGLLVTALLEDKYNQTGHLRGEANRVATLYEEKLKPFAKVVNPGFFENEPEAAKAAAMMKKEDVDLVAMMLVPGGFVRDDDLQVDEILAVVALGIFGDPGGDRVVSLFGVVGDAGGGGVVVAAGASW